MRATPIPGQDRRDEAYSNIKIIIIYSLVISASLALNTMVQTILDRFTHTDRLVGQILFFLVLLTIVIILAYYTNFKVASVL